jgi:SAM-dependent methyltransferase
MKPVYEERSYLLLYHEEQTDFAEVVSGFPGIYTIEGLCACRLGAEVLTIPRVSGCEIARYLDQYYLVLSTVDYGLRQDTIDRFFSFLAPQYEQSVDVKRNEDNINLLLIIAQTVVGRLDQSVLLDFGCGPGVSQPVAAAQGANILGFDTSAAMLRAAQARGMRTVNAERLLSSETLCFDGIIASYVLHLEPAEVWIRAAWSRVRPGGVFTGNFHKHKGIDAFIKSIDTGGGSMKFTNPPNCERHGGYVICTKC